MQKSGDKGIFWIRPPYNALVLKKILPVKNEHKNSTSVF